MPKVTIYSTQTCSYCHMLKAYLSSKNVKFDEIMIDSDSDGALKSLDTCGSMAVPCTHITLDDGTEEKILGFNKPKFDEVLGLA